MHVTHYGNEFKTKQNINGRFNANSNQSLYHFEFEQNLEKKIRHVLYELRYILSADVDY